MTAKLVDMKTMIKRIKAYFRKSPYYVKYCQCSVNNFRYSIRNLKFYLSNFKFDSNGRKVLPDGNTLYFILDPKLKHPGLTDRLKAITCMYYVAKINGFKFKLIFESPFRLSDYLDCNKVDWVGSVADVSYSYPSSKMYAYNGMAKMPHLTKSVRQYICYYYIGKNILEYNHLDNWEKTWADCFHDLFKPSVFLLAEIEKYGFLPKTYISVHLRFVNALESFEDGYYNSLAVAEQESLIDKCLKCLQRIKAKSNLPLLIFSDSNRFLAICKKNGYNILGGGR